MFKVPSSKIIASVWLRRFLICVALLFNLSTFNLSIFNSQFSILNFPILNSQFSIFHFQYFNFPYFNFPFSQPSLFAQKTIYVERELREVTIKPKKQRYKRKGNPAVELMRKVIEAKGDHDIRRNDYVSYYKYQRITSGLNNITKEMADSMKILQSPILKRQVEYCPQTGKYILPLHYTESVTQHIWRRDPSAERNFVLGTNSEGLTDLLPIGENINTIIASVFADVNIYDDVLNLLERRFTSPLSSRAAISFFQFFIEDTVEVDTKRCIQLSFVPQNPQDFGLSGRIWILNDSTYRVHKCLLSLPIRSSVNYINHLALEQRFTDLPNGQRVLQTDDMFAELGILKGQRFIMVHRATNYTDISTDSIADERFRKSDKLREGNNRVKSPDFWALHRVDTLTKAENNLKDMASSIRSLRGSGWFLYALRVAINNYLETSATPEKNLVDIGPLMSTISHNEIDGYRFRLGAQTTAHLNPHLFFKGHVAYGKQSRNWYGMGEIEYSFLRKQDSPHEYPRHSILVQAQKDVFSPSDLMWQQGRDKDNMWTSFKWQEVDHMMFQRHALMRYEVETNNYLDFKLQTKMTEVTPCGSLFYRRMNGEYVDHLRMAEIQASVRWAPGEEVINSKQRRKVVHHNNPVFTLSHTVGLKGIFGSDYHYNVSELTVFQRLWLNSYGRIDFNLRGAVQWNRVPFPHLLMPVANPSYIVTRDMFNLVNNLEFVNDQYLSLMIEWDLSGKILNRIPLIKRLKWREIIGFKMLYGRLSDKNNPNLHPGATDLFEMPSRNGVCIVHPMGDTPYMELDIGLHNILKFVRVDYVYRLNYHNYPDVKRHGFRVGLMFDF